jgi:hypothetical protein
VAEGRNRWRGLPDALIAGTAMAIAVTFHRNGILGCVWRK